MKDTGYLTLVQIKIPDRFQKIIQIKQPEFACLMSDRLRDGEDDGQRATPMGLMDKTDRQREQPIR